MDTFSDAVFQQAPVDGIDFLPRSPGLYCILNRVSGKRYVGQATKSLYQRCVKHRNELGLGLASNMLLRRDALVHGADAFFFFVLHLESNADTPRQSQLDNIEVWFAVQLCTHDERYGYNLEVGHHRTRAARFRDRERKMMRRNSGKYALLPGVDMYDPINPDLLRTWFPGS